MTATRAFPHLSWSRSWPAETISLHADGSPETGLEASSGAGEGTSDEGPNSEQSASTEAQGSGHMDGDDEATSLPHVASHESVTADGTAAPDSPCTAARKVCALPVIGTSRSAVL